MVPIALSCVTGKLQALGNDISMPFCSVDSVTAALVRLCDKVAVGTTSNQSQPAPAAQALPEPEGILSVAGLGQADLVWRCGAVLVLLVLEKSFLNNFVDFAAANIAPGFGAILRISQHYGLRLLVSLTLALGAWILVHCSPRLREVNKLARNHQISWAWLSVNLAAVGALAVLLSSLYAPGESPSWFLIHATLCLLLGLAALASLFAAAAPMRLWVQSAHAIGRAWAYALGVAVLATLAIQLSQTLWTPTAGLTFDLVRTLLQRLLPHLRADPSTLVLATDNFAVEVSDICSGLEGLGLMLVFCGAWLLYFRHEYRFPRALLIIVAGLVLVFGLNVLRIAALVLIGNAGYPEIAILGFHSQAGWIAFNGAACGVAFLSLRMPWFTRDPRASSAAPTENPTAAYLVPLLALLGAGMLSRASSAQFEWFYSLRLFICAAAVLFCWKRLVHLDLRFSWRGPLVGVMVFVAWLLASHLIAHAVSTPEALAEASAATRLYWIGTRILVAVLWVPLAEELAYRGFLMRRLVAGRFEEVPFNRVGRVPLLVSSILFGLGHGPMSGPAVLAGLAYGAVLVKTNRFGEAVAAHAVSNALIAATVLMFDQWQLW